jgi:hypothetical protein
MMPLKRCTKCGLFKPLDDFHKDHDSALGVTSRCKPCKREYERDRWRDQHASRRYEAENGLKTLVMPLLCGGCGAEIPKPGLCASCKPKGGGASECSHCRYEPKCRAIVFSRMPLPCEAIDYGDIKKAKMVEAK